MTTQQGIPIADDQNTLTIGERGPQLLEDFVMHDILLNGPDSFAGRRLGALVTDGADAKTLPMLRTAATSEGAQLALIAPTITGISNRDRSFTA